MPATRVFYERRAPTPSRTNGTMQLRPATAGRSAQRWEHRWPFSAVPVELAEPAAECSRQFAAPVAVPAVELQVEEPVPAELRVEEPVEPPLQREAPLRVAEL